MRPKISFFFLLFIAFVGTVLSVAYSDFEVISSSSFEGTQVIETYVDTDLSPGESTIYNDVKVTAFISKISVKISNANNEFQESGLLIEVTGSGIASIDFTHSVVSTQDANTENVVDQSCDNDNPDIDYPLRDCLMETKIRLIDSYHYRSGYPPLLLDGIAGVRVPGDGSLLNENTLVRDLLRLYFVRPFTQFGSRLLRCDPSKNCSGQPVLFIHGYQKEVSAPNISDNGGREYWGYFPDRLIADGYNPFEFLWFSNARFEDVAADLSEAILKIKDETGQNVHIVAHSFGGVLVRSLLQNADLNQIASSIASVTTIAAPHSGIFDKPTSVEGTDFPAGQDRLLFELCGQISCHLMGESVMGAGMAIMLLRDDFTQPGKQALLLESTRGLLPAVRIQQLIGFLKNYVCDSGSCLPYMVRKGDGLLTGRSQRFRPNLGWNAEGSQFDWPFLQNAEIGGASVSEYVLGRTSSLEPDLNLEPEQSPLPDNYFIPFKHSSGTPDPTGRGRATDILDEPVIPPPDKENNYQFNDVYQRVVDWINLQEFILTVEVTASGLVTSSPSGIDCDSTCSASFYDGTPLTLTANDVDGWVFDSWSGTVCSGQSSTCVFALNSNQTVGAIFTEINSSNFTQLGIDIDGEVGGDWFGESVSLSANGDRLAIGAPNNDVNGENSGQVRVYQWSGFAWQQLGLAIDGEASGYGSGWAVSLSGNGNRVAIGAPAYPGGQYASGQVRVYQWTGSTWEQLGANFDVNYHADEFLGSAVALSTDGNRIAIEASAPWVPEYSYVRVYQWSGFAWEQLGIDLDGSTSLDATPISFSTDGNRIAIGKPVGSGLVRVYQWSGSTWQQLGIDIAGEAGVDITEYGDQSGYAVSISGNGNRVAIGAIRNDGDGGIGYDSGHVRVYQWSGSVWQKLGMDIDGETGGDWSGYSVSMSADGNQLAIGAIHNDSNGSDSGHVRVYQWSGSVWQKLGMDIDGETGGDWSGYSVSLSADGSRLTIGAPQNDGNGSDSGHVRVFAINPN